MARAKASQSARMSGRQTLDMAACIPPRPRRVRGAAERRQSENTRAKGTRPRPGSRLHAAEEGQRGERDGVDDEAVHEEVEKPEGRGRERREVAEPAVVARRGDR